MNLFRIVRQTSVLASIVLTSFLIYSNAASAQQRACVITDEGATVCGKLTTSTKKSNQSSEKRQEFDKLVFSLKGCRRYDGDVKCNFTITNKSSEDRTLHVYTSDSSFVDSSGRSHKGSNLEIGEKSSSGQITISVSPGIDYASTLTFEKIPEQITQVPLLNIKTYHKLIQFRNISFSN